MSSQSSSHFLHLHFQDHVHSHSPISHLHHIAARQDVRQQLFASSLVLKLRRSQDSLLRVMRALSYCDDDPSRMDLVVQEQAWMIVTQITGIGLARFRSYLWQIIDV